MGRGNEEPCMTDFDQDTSKQKPVKSASSQEFPLQTSPVITLITFDKNLKKGERDNWL